MSWFDKLMPSRISTENRTKSVPEGVWVKCARCDAQLYRNELERNLQVCPKCDHHMRIGARKRLEYFLDPDSQTELSANLEPEDPLKFKDSKRYRDRLVAAQKKTGEKDALISVTGFLLGRPVVVCAFDFEFMGGSMGSVVGERFARAANHAAENKMPMISFSARARSSKHNDDNSEMVSSRRVAESGSRRSESRQDNLANTTTTRPIAKPLSERVRRLK